MAIGDPDLVHIAYRVSREGFYPAVIRKRFEFDIYDSAEIELLGGARDGERLKVKRSTDDNTVGRWEPCKKG